MQYALFSFFQLYTLNIIEMALITVKLNLETILLFKSLPFADFFLSKAYFTWAFGVHQKLGSLLPFTWLNPKSYMK